MKYNTFLIVVTLIFCNINAKGVIPFIPMPNSVEYKDSSYFIIDDKTTLGLSNSELKLPFNELKNVLNHRTGKNFKETATSEANIILELDPSINGNEHYKLDINPNNLKITGSTPEAVFRGIKTLDQLLLDSSLQNHKITLPTITIDDEPRYAYRAIMLDPARHFLTVEEIKLFIDQIAKYKFNVLQLHLSDDQGWRVQLNSHPEISSPQSYSRKDLEDIINYAAEKYIEVVPEIDIPGHTAAFLSVYPQLGCIHQQSQPIEVGETVNRMLCASNLEVYNIFEDIFQEISSIFPSDYIHLGGDEAAIKANWAKCDSCLNLMEEYGFKDPSQLMIPFFDKMLGFVRANGKKPILWCELDNIYPPANDFLFPYPEDVTLVSWRAGLTPTCLNLTNQNGYPLIMAPGEYAYLDYPQLKGDLPEFNNWGMPVTPLEKTYEFDPGYGLSSELQNNVLGIMGTLWGEAIKDINRATYMAFPRSFSLAEAGWTNMDNRDWESFKTRIYPNLYDLMKSGISFRVPYEIAR